MPARKRTDAISSENEFLGQPDDKKLIIQMHKEMWEELRRLSFELNISMAELCRKGITLLLEKSQQGLLQKTK